MRANGSMPKTKSDYTLWLRYSAAGHAMADFKAQCLAEPGSALQGAREMKLGFE